MNFNGKVIIITGASSGIGAATAEHFAKLNGTLSLVGRNMENLTKTKENCQKINQSVKLILIQGDVTKDCKKIVDETILEFGKIDILVNNAGIVTTGSILEADVNQFDTILNTNLRSVFELTKLVVPYLIETKGNIVNVSSVAGLRSMPGIISYCVSKAALDQFTKCTALDLASKNVRVNAVNPGVIITDILRRGGGMNEEDYQNYLEHSKTTNPLGRVGDAMEVASVIGFLASNAASYITGCCLPIDGGWHTMCPR